MTLRLLRVIAVARHERRRHLREQRTAWTAGLFAAVFVTSLTVSWTDYRRVTAANGQEAIAERSRWLSQGNKRPDLAGDQGVVVFQPISPLSIFDPGVLSYVGSSFLLDVDHEHAFAARTAEFSNSLRHIGRFSPAMIVEVFAPLLIGLLLFDAVAGERDAATLSQVAAAGASGVELVFGKVLGASSLLGCLAASAIALTTGLIVAASPMAELSDNLIRTAAITVTLATFAVLWMITVLSISCIARSAQQALVMVVIVWFGGCFVCPRVASDLAEWWAPAPNAFAYGTSQIDAASRIPTLEEHRTDVRRRLLEQYHVTSLRHLPVDPIGVEMLESDRLEMETIHPIVTGLYDAIGRQEAVGRRLGWLNPALLARSLSMAIADADFGAHRRFAEAADQYRRSFSQILHVAVRDHPAYRTGAVFPGTDIIVTPGSPELWASVPPFIYQRQTARSVIVTHASELIGLLGWVVAAGMLLGVAAGRVAAR